MCIMNHFSYENKLRVYMKIEKKAEGYTVNRTVVIFCQNGYKLWGVFLFLPHYSSG